MGLATLAIGFLPGYATIGVAAPVLLMMLRVVQGIGLGGEWGGAVSWAGETAYRSRWKGLVMGTVTSTFGIGGFMATVTISLVSLLTGEHSFIAYSWRYTFYIGTIVLLVAAILRLVLMDSPLYVKIKETGRIKQSPAMYAIKKYWRWIIVLSFLIGPITLSTFSASYVVTYLVAGNMSLAFITFANSVGQLDSVFSSPFAGFLSDPIGRKRAGFLGACLLFIGLPIYYEAVISFNHIYFLAATVFLLFCSQFVGGVTPSFFMESFPTEVRYTAGGLPTQFGTLWAVVITFAVYTPLIGTFHGVSLAFPWLVLGSSILPIITLFLWPFMKETRQRGLETFEEIMVK